MRTHLNTGHDIETALQMMTAIESSGGIAGVRVTVSGPQPTAMGGRWIHTQHWIHQGRFAELVKLALANFLTLKQISPTSWEPSSVKQTETEFQR